MSVCFVLGRAGAGKTHYCLEGIRNQLLASAEGVPLILLVPEQATHAGISFEDLMDWMVENAACDS